MGDKPKKSKLEELCAWAEAAGQDYTLKEPYKPAWYSKHKVGDEAFYVAHGHDEMPPASVNSALMDAWTDAVLALDADMQNRRYPDRN